MGIDIQRFHETFFEESREGLQILEAGLLALDRGAADPDALNRIFRAAHSIKGGAGTFGFTAIADFTHGVESTLDQLREGRLTPDRDLIDILLRAADVMGMLLDAAQSGDDVEIDAITATQQALAAYQPQTSIVCDDATASLAPTTEITWRIRFQPHEALFASGNEPLRLLRELSGLGALQVEADPARLPPLDTLDPEACYLGWTLTLTTNASRAQVEEIFAWVEDECDLEIEPLPAPSPGPSAATADGDEPPARRQSAAGGESSLRVSVDKIDALINLVGELVINQAMLQQQAQDLDPVHNEMLLSGLSQLELHTRRLQEAVMATRMVPMAFVFNRFPRVVRDLAGRLGKRVQLETLGESTELDRGVIERITDPLNHIVRNSLDHGLETPEQRRAAGKPETGTVTLEASHEGGHIVIRVSDDGRGLDRDRLLAKAAERGIPCQESMSNIEVWQLIFAPGFSTAAAVTDVSGRGVGMDVVKRNITNLGGQVEVASETGRGTDITIRLPLTLAILDGMTVAVGAENYIIPLHSVVESLQPGGADVRRLAGSSKVVRFREEFLPLVSAAAFFGVERAAGDNGAVIVVVESGGQRLALQVDDLLGQQQVVIKSLEANYRHVAGVAGATILGDGRVALILDIGELIGATRRPAAA
ncbi:chemotaxis protein CheA [Spectribacter hydrogenoxidans]|uniref:Chemotaxis protein CheA n=1 Tax=Spectribacter hydrogenoxidans TaxID=3075608 RepID=A0ABU3BVP0_9GAMM|nr:chemotaxis protein CheA [Salinisphaera sp. W335]MDT0633356.1 chemotaxis protein CheA [Salinisphaera sp. W335]